VRSALQELSANEVALPPTAGGGYLNLRPIAKSMGVEQSTLVEAAAAGRFAPVLRLSERTYVVRAEDLAAWERRAEVSPATEGLRRAFLDDTPAEPFVAPTAPEKTAAPRGNGASARLQVLAKNVGKPTRPRRRAHA
jgi:hypothetical protein